MSRPTPIRVAVHLRPLLQSEQDEGAASIVVVSGNRVGASAAAVSGAAAAAPLSFGAFDGVFSSSSAAAAAVSAARPPQTMYADLVEPLVRAVVEDAESACVLAYGATGGGKTYTMGTTANTGAGKGDNDDDGFVPLAPAAIRDLCHRCEQLRQVHGPDAARIYASCLEVYGESLHDLLAAASAAEDASAAEPPSSSASASSPPPPPVIAWRDPGASSASDDDPQTLSLPGLTEVPADDPDAAIAALRAACRGRATASTGANARSSRSHAVFSLRVRTRRGAGGETCEARLMLVDLAGSERQARSGAGGQRLAEACAINQGLLALGNVIDALAFNARALAAAEGGGGIGAGHRGQPASAALDGGAASLLATPCSSAPSSPRASTIGGAAGPFLAPFVPPLALPGLTPAAAAAPSLRHVPFRSHVLTRLLRPALGGSSRTVMVACVSPSDAAWPETCCSLRYAQRLRAVRTRPRRGVLLPPPGAAPMADAAMAAALKEAQQQLARLLEERKGLEARAKAAEDRADGLAARLREAEKREQERERERAADGKAAAAATAASTTASPMKRRDSVVALGPGGDAPSPGRARGQQQQAQQHQQQQHQQQQQQQLARALAAAEARAAQRDEAVRQLVEARLALAEAEERLRQEADDRQALVARYRQAEGARRALAAASSAASSHQPPGVVGAATAAVGAALASLTGSLRR